MNHTQQIGVAVGATSVVSLIVGAASGYFFAKKRLEKIYADFASQEIAEARKFYSKNKKFSTPEEAVEALIPDEAVEALKAYQGEPDVVLETTEDVVVNIFGSTVSHTKDEWAQVVSMRDEDEPHIISQEEFMEGGPGYHQPTLSYYVGDDILADERDQPITDVTDLLGEDNLKFGYGSGDANIVYIRNNKLSLDIEIIKSEGKYSEEVAGFHQSNNGSG